MVIFYMSNHFYVSSDLTIPTIVVLNTSNQQYFLPDRHIENTEDMVQFINNILDGTAEVSLHCDFKYVVGVYFTRC